MTWSRIVAACTVACVAASFTDWLFFGVLFHDRYLAFPEVWRRSVSHAAGWIAKLAVSGATVVWLMS